MVSSAPTEPSCTFCGIIAAGGKVVLRVLPDSVVLRPRHPTTRNHLLVVAKQHYDNLEAVPTADPAVLGALLRDACTAAKLLRLHRYRINVNVPGNVHHLHFHLDW